jgi:hypothetical protein
VRTTNIRSRIGVATAVTGAACGACILAAPLVAGSTTGGHAGWRVIARGHSSYDSGNSSSIAAHVTRPHALAVRLSVDQGTTARVQWNLSCSKGKAGHGGRSVTKGGRFNGAPELFRSLPLPIKNPDACDVIVNVLAAVNAAIETDYDVAIKLDLLQR